jgi:hypothetical protein
MLRALDQPETCRHTIGIANSTARLPEIVSTKEGCETAEQRAINL